MQLNTVKPAEGAKQNSKRLGRGIGSGKGKTCGRGHKGQRSRAGKNVKRGFEGGQMPLQRRLPKFGFTSRKSLFRDEIRLHELNQFKGEVNVETLKKAGLVRSTTLYVKVIATGEIKTAIELRGIKATKQAVEKITAAGGKVEA